MAPRLVDCLLHLAAQTRYPIVMNQSLFLAAGALLLGVILTLASITDGLRFSWPLVLGLLLVADGVLRLLALREETGAT